MRIDEVKRIDWRKNPELIGVQEKVAGFAQRETAARARLEELDRTVQDSEQSLIQATAAEMLGETSDESVEGIQGRLESARRETADIRTTIAALAMARARLEPAVLAATAAAKLQVGVVLAPVYERATLELRDLLTKAEALNALLHLIHEQTLKCELRRAAGGRPDLKAVCFPMAIHLLGLPGGKPNLDLEIWRDHVSKFYGDN